VPAPYLVPPHLREFLNEHEGQWSICDAAWLDCDPATIPEQYEPGQQRAIMKYALRRVTHENIRTVLYTFNRASSDTLNRAQALAVVTGLNVTMAAGRSHRRSL
jgi:hypothetical protein